MKKSQHHCTPRITKCDRKYMEGWHGSGKRMKDKCVAKDADEQIAECTHPNSSIHIRYTNPCIPHWIRCPDCGLTWEGKGLLDKIDDE